MRAGRKPVHQMACGLRRLVGSGLNVAEEERNHKKGSGKDEKDFEGGDGAFEVHAIFVPQSTVRCKVDGELGSKSLMFGKSLADGGGRSLRRPSWNELDTED